MHGEGGVSGGAGKRKMRTRRRAPQPPSALSTSLHRSSRPEGLLLINKPSGLTSHDVVDVVRRKLGLRRVGHTGTLDPAAEGLLIVLVGSATRFQQQLQEHRLTVELVVAPDVPALQGDPERLRQILVNLLDNAIKFNTRGGRITVRARPEQGRLRIDIEDTGIGIPAEDLPRVFERFYRADKARAREQGGTGLGLAIVKHLVDLHHGAVSAESAPGRGSTFTLLLPLSRG